jgi:glycerol-3-phosphate acyltransferase PlsY
MEAIAMYLPWILILVGYLVGGVPIGLLIGRSRGVDLTHVGSGNIGASNVMRTLGAKFGILVWLADLLKGLVPVVWAGLLIRTRLDDPWPYLAAVGFAAVLGHCFSPYLRLHGGRGVSTSLGAVLGLDWRVGLIAFAGWIFLLILSRYISLSSIVAAISVPVLFAFLKPETAATQRPFLIMGIALAALVLLKHIPNIKRLLTGTESKVGEKTPLPMPEGIEGGPESETEYR